MPNNFSIWFLLGNCHVGRGELYEAEGCFGTCVALLPNSLWAYLHRGLCRLELKRYQEAEADFGYVLRLRPGMSSALLNRALAFEGQNNLPAAVEDLTQALAAGGPSRIYFLRSRCYRRLGEEQLAERDLEEGRRQEPTDEKSFIARGIARLPTDPQGALDDFEMACRINPASFSALQNIAHVLGERLGQTEQALDALNAWLKIQPDSAPARAARGVLLARLGRRNDAIGAGQAALRISHHAKTFYQVACIYSLTSQSETSDAQEALRLLSRALQLDAAWAKVAMRDPDLQPLRNHESFEKLLAASRLLADMSGRDEKGAH
jgi:tetratricopeptide (TPR) repeat protein